MSEATIPAASITADAVRGVTPVAEAVTGRATQGRKGWSRLALAIGSLALRESACGETTTAALWDVVTDRPDEEDEDEEMGC